MSSFPYLSLPFIYIFSNQYFTAQAIQISKIEFNQELFYYSSSSPARITQKHNFSNNEPRHRNKFKMVAIASPHMARAMSKAAPKSGLPIFLVFCGMSHSQHLHGTSGINTTIAIAGPYTYFTAKQEGADMDAARHRFQTTKQRNDLRISGGAPIQHLDVEAAHLPGAYKGPAALAEWR